MYLQKLVKHRYKDRRTKTSMRFKALLGTDFSIPSEITTAVFEYIVPVLVFAYTALTPVSD